MAENKGIEPLQAFTPVQFSKLLHYRSANLPVYRLSGCQGKGILYTVYSILVDYRA